MQFTKRIIVDEATFVEYNESMMWKRQRITLYVLTLLMALLSMYLSGIEQFLVALAVGVAVAVVFYFASYYFMKSTGSKSAKKIYAKNGLQEMFLQMTVNEKGILQRYEAEEAQFGWDLIKNLVETKHAYYFYYSRLDALIIAKQSLTEEEKKTIETIAEQKLGTHKMKKIVSH